MEHPEHDEAGHHADEADGADLLVIEQQDLLEHATPTCGVDRRHQSLKDQKQRQGHPESIGHPAARLLARTRGATSAAHGLEEITARIKHHDIGLAAEGRTIGFQAAIELGELRITTEGVGIQC